MTIYAEVTIDGTKYTDAKSINIRNSIGDNNSASSFSITFPNWDGIHKTDFSINDEVIVYADKDVNPPTTKVLTGIIEEINFLGRETEEEIEISGRDYTARLQDATVEPTVYNDSEVSTIVSNIMTNFVPSIGTTNVNATTTTLTHIRFNHTPVFDALKQLAELSDFYFYVDVNKDLNFKRKSQTSSGQTLNNTNVLSTSFRNTDIELFNRIYIYGDRTLTGAQQTFTADGAGSVFTLSQNPHNIEVLKDSVIVERGGIFEMNLSPATGLKWLSDFDQKKIIFISGTATGDNIPASGAVIKINYYRSNPIVKLAEDAMSIAQYGPRTKIIVDKNIINPNQASDFARSELEKWTKGTTLQGDISIRGIVTLLAGQTVVVNLPDENISSQTYDILEVSYEFNKENNLSERVATIRVNKRIKDITDTLKEIALSLRKIEGAEITDSDVITRLLNATGSFGLKVKDWNVSIAGIGSTFIFHHEVNGKLGDERLLLGDHRETFAIQRSGGE